MSIPTTVPMNAKVIYSINSCIFTTPFSYNFFLKMGIKIAMRSQRMATHTFCIILFLFPGHLMERNAFDFRRVAVITTTRVINIMIWHIVIPKINRV